MLTIDDFKKVYELLDNATPLSCDCGKMCGAVCCKPKKTFLYSSLWVYMLPGEDCLHDKNDKWLKWYRLNSKKHLFPKSWGKRFWAVRCTGPEHCKRELRPIQCRTFPLMPYLGADGEFQLILFNQPLPYECPLVTEGYELEESFITNVRNAWEILLQDNRIFDYVKADSERIRKAGDAIQIIESE
ncbi:MAG: hypothetical protein MJ086_05455 [Lachnospiraceae bacterium]|nr:hypothetical protein [Lachnospiraceae bacterium]